MVLSKLSLRAGVAMVALASFGVVMGGPQRMNPRDIARVTGGDDKSVGDCNGIGLAPAICPSNCNPGTYNIPHSAAAGGMNVNRYDPWTLMCSSDATNKKCARYDHVLMNKDGKTCKEKQVPSTPIDDPDNPPPGNGD
jgi:invasion protein IalB